MPRAESLRATGYDHAMPSGPDIFQGVNAAYVAELYEKYQRDPHSVDPATREFFESWTPPENLGTPEPSLGTSEPRNLALAVGAFNLAQSIRRYGHLAAQIDPLGSRPRGDAALEPSTHGVGEEDLRQLPASLVTGPVAENALSMGDVADRLRGIYCSTTGYDFAHIFLPEERHWLRNAVETGRFRAPADPIDPVKLLDRLTQGRDFQRF